MPFTPTRIVLVHSSDEMYGADRVVLELVPVLHNLWPAARVECWIPDDLDYPERRLSAALGALGVHVQIREMPVLRRAYVNPKGFFTRVRSFKRLGTTAGFERSDLVYITTSAMLAVAPLARLRGSRVVCHLHEHWGMFETMVLTGPLLACRRVFCVSNAVLSALPHAVRKRCTVVHNGFAIERGKDRTKTDNSTLENSRHTAIGLLMASRWNSWKGHQVLFDAFDQVKRDDLTLTVLGGPPPSGEAADIVAMVAGMRRKNAVSIVGEVSSAEAYIESCDAVVVPSVSFDPLPTIAIEACAKGRAVIGSDVGGLPEIIDSRESGYLVCAGDRSAWTAVFEGLNVSVLREMGSCAYERYLERFTREQFSAKMRYCLSSLD